MDSATYRPGARRIGHRAQRQAVRLDDPAGPAGDGGVGRQPAAGPAGGPGQLGRRDRGHAGHHRRLSLGQDEVPQQRLSDRADRPSRRRHGAEGRRRQDAPAGRLDPRAAAAEASAVRQVRADAARSPPAAGREGLAAGRGLPDPQSAAPGPRIRPGLRPGDAAAGRAQRRGLPQSADRRDQGRRRRRRRADAHLRGPDREPRRWATATAIRSCGGRGASRCPTA